jgi:ketosteroid isomerase-like protein
MTSLPEADAATRAYFIAWLERFAGYVREVDYAAARPLFHPDILAFGTHRDIISGLATWQATQWDNVWPKTSDFRFDTDAARILASADNTMATVVVSWTSTGYTQNGAAFDRPGRATMVFHKNGGAWLCTHSHMSLNRGVPQQSFANRSVKAG